MPEFEEHQSRHAHTYGLADPELVRIDPEPSRVPRQHEHAPGGEVGGDHPKAVEDLQQITRSTEVIEKRRVFEVLEMHLLQKGLLKLGARQPTATSAAVPARHPSR